MEVKQRSQRLVGWVTKNLLINSAIGNSEKRTYTKKFSLVFFIQNSKTSLEYLISGLNLSFYTPFNIDRF
jgi:hypothetical protein